MVYFLNIENVSMRAPRTVGSVADLWGRRVVGLMVLLFLRVSDMGLKSKKKNFSIYF